MSGFTAAWAAWLLLGIFVISWLLVRAASKQQQAIGQFASWLVVTPARRMVHLEGALLCIAWLAGVAALMGPRGVPHAPEDATGESQVLAEQVTGEGDELFQSAQRRVAHDVIFLVDASASMTVTDTRLGLSRLEYAKEIIDEAVGQLDGQSVALYAFTSELTTVVPLTVDYLYTRLMLRQLGINAGDAAGTDLMEAFDAVRRRHARGGTEKSRTLIVLTDGGDTRLESASPSEREHHLEAIVGRLRDINGSMRIFCVGLGSHAGEVIPGITFEDKPVCSSLDEELLKRVSETGAGHYYFANDFSSFSLAEQLCKQIRVADTICEEEVELPIVDLERVEQEEIQLVFERYFRVPLLLAIVALGGTLFLRRQPCTV